MPRTRKALGATTEARIAALVKSGRSVDEALQQLRLDGVKGVSRATLGRRMSEQRGGASKKRRAGAATKTASPITPDDIALPASPDDIPADADLATIDAMIRKAERMADAAFAKADLEGFGRMSRLVPALINAKLKATPAKPLDANADPDMIAARAHAVEMFHHLIDKVLPP